MTTDSPGTTAGQTTPWADLLDAHVDGLAERRAQVDDPDGDPVVRALQARVIFDHMFQFTGLTDLDGVLIDANRTALSAVGMDRSEVVGVPVWETPWWTVDEQTQRDLENAIAEAQETGELVRYDVEVYASPAQERTIPIDFSVRPARDRDGRIAYLVLEGRDITEKKEAERLKDQLFANVSHELRTPLSLILGRVERLLDEADLPAGLADDLSRTRDNALVLLDQVNTLLEIAALEQGAVGVSPTTIDLAPFVRRVADVFAPATAERDQELTVDAPGSLPARTDPRHLETVLRNLVGNAVKFTPDGGTIRVRLARDGDEVWLSVADSGPGIPGEERERVRNPFERGAGRDADPQGATGGTGLGLAIVDRLAGLLGGGLTIGESGWGGARLTVRLPHEPPATDGGGDPTVAPGRDRGVADRALAAADRLTSDGRADGAVVPAGADGDAPAGDADTAGPPARSVGTREAPAVLVVEDNPDLARFLAEELGGGHRLAVAGDGREAVAMIEAGEADPDLVVTDLMMPGMTGRDLIGLLPELGLGDVPVLVLTAREDQQLREELLVGGADDFLVKPFSSAELRARIANLLRPRLANRRLQQLNDALQDHAHRLSHDLKTPLSTVTGMAATLAERGEELPADQRRQLTERIVAASRRLEQMVDDILAGATGTTMPGAVDPAEVLGEVTDLLRETIEETDASVTTAGGLPAVVVDPAALHEVLLNVVANSLRYRDPDRAPRITVAARRDGDEVVLAVDDNGRGIAPENRERIFEAGERGRAAADGTGGSGRGLSRARELVARNGGTIRAAGDGRPGATIVMRLPAAG